MQKKEYQMNGLVKLVKEKPETWISLESIVHVSKSSEDTFKVIFNAGTAYSMDVKFDEMPDVMKSYLNLGKPNATTNRKAKTPTEKVVSIKKETDSVEEKKD